MSYLAIEQLENNVVVAQKIRISNSMSIETLRLNMYKTGLITDGLITVDVYSGEVLIGSMSHECIDFNSIGTNFHGMISFYADSPIVIKKDPRIPFIELTFKVKVSSHTDSNTAFIGLVRNQNPINEMYNTNNNPNNPDPEVDVYYLPFGIELQTI